MITVKYTKQIIITDESFELDYAGRVIDVGLLLSSSWGSRRYRRVAAEDRVAP